MITQNMRFWRTGLLFRQTRLINPPFNQHVHYSRKGVYCWFCLRIYNHNFERGTFIDALHVDSNYRGRGLVSVSACLNCLNDYNNNYSDSGALPRGDVWKSSSYYVFMKRLVENKNWSRCGTRHAEVKLTWEKSSLGFSRWPRAENQKRCVFVIVTLWCFVRHDAILRLNTLMPCLRMFGASFRLQ